MENADQTKEQLLNELAELREREARNRRLIEELREDREQYSRIINNVKDGIFIETVRGKILDVNEAGCRMLGYSREELLSMDVGTLVPPQTAARLPEAIQEETVREGVYIETVNVRKDGAHIPVEVSNTLIEIGGEKRVIAILHDITDRVKAREKLRAAYEDLEAKVRERTEELARANVELKKHRDHLEDIVEQRTAEMNAMVDAMARRVVRMSDLEVLIDRLKKQIRDRGLIPGDEEEL